MKYKLKLIIGLFIFFFALTFNSNLNVQAENFNYISNDYVNPPLPEINKLEPVIYDGLMLRVRNAANLNTDADTGIHYRYLDDTSKKMYRALYKAALNVYPHDTASFLITDSHMIGVAYGDTEEFTFTADQYQAAYEAVRYDHPDMVQFNACVVKMWSGYTSYTSSDVKVYNTYLCLIANEGYDQAKFDEITAEIQQGRTRFLNDSSITNATGKYAKELAIHDLLLNITTYDYDCLAENTVYNMGHSVYGIVKDGKAVCDGYAMAFSYLLEGIGINSVIVSSQSHAWNVVQLGYEWYEVDVTWDDVNSTDEGILHKYYNLSTEQISDGSAARTRTDASAKFPIAYGTTYNYTYVKELIFKNSEAALVSVTGLTLAPQQLTGKTGDSGRFTLTYSPENANNRSVLWESSNTDVILVDDYGYYILKGPGSATVTAMTANGTVKSSASVYVTDENDNIFVGNITLSDTLLECEYGDTGIITYTVAPANATNKNIIWESSNKYVATVEDKGAEGIVYTVTGPGKAIITAKSEDGSCETACEINVPYVNIKVTYDLAGGTGDVEDNIWQICGRRYSLPMEVTREGYEFAGWYTAKEGGDKVNYWTVVTAKEDHTLYAHWNAIKYTITFNANGGSVVYADAQREVAYGDAIGELPEAAFEGYTFDGWFDAAEGGNEVTATAIVTGDMTLYAHWTIIPPEDPEPEQHADPDPEPEQPADPDPEPTQPADPDPEPEQPADPDPEPTQPADSDPEPEQPEELVNPEPEQSEQIVNPEAEQSVNNEAEQQKAEVSETETGTAISKNDVNDSAQTTANEAVLPADGNIEVAGKEYHVDETGNATVMVAENKDVTSVKIGDTVNYNGESYKVTVVQSKAYKNCKKLKSLTLGSNIEKIGSGAFSGCKNLGKITIKANNLKTVGGGSFKGIKNGAKITVVCKDKKTYDKVVKKLKKAGAKTAKFKFKKG
ncbi:Listeria/Bacterioides repeat-containing protein [Butyrivibrio sp. ob235]|uniref:InlB B-repeat-containing protein n=1 Tax=Butyrivibrio sp. ob235 TaxID=1761780 RepID=UPI0008C6568D|nr:InlB B-repeat-containing protein [Butyrivibrio sp. ob235]SEL55021.1 Listeria/Bacterioides repeat-containing protein [Butyrivibrio sp. ob235]